MKRDLHVTFSENGTPRLLPTLEVGRDSREDGTARRGRDGTQGRHGTAQGTAGQRWQGAAGQGRQTGTAGGRQGRAGRRAGDGRQGRQEGRGRQTGPAGGPGTADRDGRDAEDAGGRVWWHRGRQGRARPRERVRGKEKELVRGGDLKERAKARRVG